MGPSARAARRHPIGPDMSAGKTRGAPRCECASVASTIAKTT
jgi:hypothetical protein